MVERRTKSWILDLLLVARGVYPVVKHTDQVSDSIQRE